MTTLHASSLLRCVLCVSLCLCRDDVGDHERWAKHFNAPRILHTDEVVPDTEAVEVKLTGEPPGSAAAHSSNFN